MTIPMAGLITKETKKEEEETVYREAFDYFDWNKGGTIPTSVSLTFSFGKYRVLVHVNLDV
jgi:hypothetical protein